jgi:inner membrane protein
MPFSSRWSYGDALFIVDPWVWAVLVAGIFIARKRARAATDAGVTEPHPAGVLTRPARNALAITVIYMGLMLGMNALGRVLVQREARAQGWEPRRVMLAPVPVNAFERFIVLEDADAYRVGTLQWLPRPRVRFDDLEIPNYPASPEAAGAIRGPAPRKFLSWARFPYFVVDDTGGRRRVCIGDVRYTLDPTASWAATCVPMDQRTGLP